MKKIYLIALLTATFALPSHSFAGLNDPTELGLQVGYLIVEGDSNLKNALVYGARFGTYLTDHTSIELSLLAGKSDIKNSNRTADLLLPMAEGHYHFGQGPWRPFLSAGAGFLQANRDRTVDKNEINFAVSYGGGVKWYWRPNFIARGDLRHIIDTQSGTGTHNALMSVGVSWLYGGSASEPVVVKKKAKPLPVPVAKKATAPVDADNDGVPDSVDRCPGTPAGTQVNSVGCPQDSDHDGITDNKDACPDSPYGMKVNERGCVTAEDTDNDGVEDDKDDCPGTPVGTKVGVDGCPQEAKAVPQENWVLTGVTFEKNADKLTGNKQVALETALEILKTHSKLRVEIQGHTDSFGKPDLNQRLSERRAQSVKNYLVQNGIDADRLEAKGYGETQPVATNTTPEGRAQNRRIEFKVLSR